MAKLTSGDVLKLARLSKLRLTDDEVDRFAVELGSIVEYVEQLQEIDVEGLLPTNQVTGLTNVTRPDAVLEYASQEQLLKNLPNREDNYIKVKRVIE